MKNKTYLLSIILVISAISQSVKAYDFSEVSPSGHILCYTITTTNWVEVAPQNSQTPRYNNLHGNLIIPRNVSYNGQIYEVTAIGERAFLGCNNLLTVSLPESIIYIKDYAFWDCSNITDINIPTTVSTIGKYSFGRCFSIWKLVIPEHVNMIGEKAFLSVLNVEYTGSATTNKPWGAKTLNGYSIEGADNNTKPCTNHIKDHNNSTIKAIEQTINQDNDGIVGIYEDVSDGKNRVGVVKYGTLYKILYISGGNNSCWRTGHIKAELRPTATNGLYKGTWYMSNFSANNNCIVTFDGMTMDIIVDDQRMMFIKMYPSQGSSSSAITNAEKWSGTGWALGSGYLVTNYHVIDGARTITINGIDGDLNTGYSAELVATDKTNDIALLKIKDSRFKGFGTIPYAVSCRIADKGEGVFVLGYPMTQVLGNEVKYTAGEINSRTGFQGDVATYQISAPVTHGNSGGPMFDSKGNVIGIVNSGITDKEIAENVGYAIKISYLKILIESAGLNITLPSNNTISTLSKQEKIKKVEKFVYYIECRK